MEIFSFPVVYDVAFQFRNARKAVDFIEWCIRRYAEIPIRTVVDIACGTGFYTREIARRQYVTYGIDINREICQYAHRKLHAESLNTTILCGDMIDFSLPTSCELAVNLFDSLTYLTDRRSFITHLHTVSRRISPGGLYILELGVIDSFDNHNVEEVWTETRRKFSVTVSYFRDSWIHPHDRTFEETCSFQAVCRKHVAFFQVKLLKFALYLEEFDQLVKQAGGFTIAACYDDFDRKALLDDTVVPWRVILVLKRL